MPEQEMTANLFLFSNAAGKVKPEARLVERICAGDEDAFGEFYKMFAPLVHGILLARVPFDEVDDLVQEVFIAAYRNLPNLREKAAVGAWLVMIARNRAAEFFRRMRPTVELTEEIRHNDKPLTEAKEILRAIRDLPEAYRETLVLRLVEGMTGPEIAEKTGLTPESVRVNLHRGMKILRQKLGVEEKQ